MMVLLNIYLANCKKSEVVIENPGNDVGVFYAK